MAKRDNMGFDFGLDDPNTCFKRKHRWLLKILDISAEGVKSLPPSKSSRPSISFKEMEAQHLNETVYFPGKPEWKPINLSLYETRNEGSQHPVFQWINDIYDPRDGSYVPSCDGFKRPEARLELYDGCGNSIETWIFESIWPQSIEFGELDMTTSDLVICDLTLRYDRAYIKYET